MRPTRGELYEHLRERPRDSRSTEFDAAFWAQAGAEVAVLVIDMSGFTRLTRQRGVLHFLSLHAELIQMVSGLAAATGGWLVKGEADNAIVAFDSPEQAVTMALALVKRAGAVNGARAETDRILPCVGIAYGPILLLADDVYGDAVNVAYKLGEDVAEPLEILVEGTVAAELADAGYRFGPRAAAVCGRVELHYRPLLAPEA